MEELELRKAVGIILARYDGRYGQVKEKQELG